MSRLVELRMPACGASRLFPKCGCQLLLLLPEKPSLAISLLFLGSDAETLMAKGVEHVGRDLVVRAIVLEPSIDPSTGITDVDAGFIERLEEEPGEDVTISLHVNQTFCELALAGSVR